LGILELQTDLALIVERLEEVEDVDGVEGVSMVSSLSPDSVELELILSSLLSRRMRMAPERSSANWATR
jgi:hypothetical protein